MAQGEPGRITGHTLYGFAGTPATLCMDLQELRPLSLICCTDLQELWPHSLWICQNSGHTLYGFAGTPATLCTDLQELRPLSLICCTDLQELRLHSLISCTYLLELQPYSVISCTPPSLTNLRKCSEFPTLSELCRMPQDFPWNSGGPCWPLPEISNSP